MRCIKDNVVTGKNSLCNFKTQTCYNAIVGNCNLPNACSNYANTVIGHCNGLTVCNGGTYNIIIGNRNACISGTHKNIGSTNTAIGYFNFRCSLNGNYNTAIGALNMCGGILSGAYYNIGIGYQNLRSITTGDYNVGMSAYSGYNNATGGYNVYMGYFAGKGNCTGQDLFI